MPVPTGMTEQQLADYMQATLQDVALDLAMTPVELGSYAEAVNNALIAYGTNDAATITGLSNIATLRALARVEAWRVAHARAAARYDFQDGTQSLKRSQMFAMIEKALAAAESEAAELGGGDMVAAIDSIHYSQDPYAPVPDALAAALGI